MLCPPCIRKYQQ